MEKYYKQILGTPIQQDDIPRPISSVKDLILDPESGKLVAIVVDINNDQVISASDILKWGAMVKVPISDVIVDAEEILRIEEIRRNELKIIRNKVFTEKGDFLGKVVDYSIETSSLILNKIYVQKTFLGLISFKSRLIPANKIVEIRKNKIIVKNDMVTIKKEDEKSGVKMGGVPT